MIRVPNKPDLKTNGSYTLKFYRECTNQPLPITSLHCQSSTVSVNLGLF